MLTFSWGLFVCCSFLTEHGRSLKYLHLKISKILREPKSVSKQYWWQPGRQERKRLTSRSALEPPGGHEEAAEKP